MRSTCGIKFLNMHARSSNIRAYSLIRIRHKYMDTTKAFLALGLNRTASSQEVEDRFRSLANDVHPDKGGSDEQMSELNEARATALKFIADSNALVPEKALQEALVAVQSKTLNQQDLSNRIAESRKIIRDRTTNKLRKYRLASTMLAAICGGAIFIVNDIPKELFFARIPESALLHMDMSRREEIEATYKDINAFYSRLWLAGWFGLVVISGIGAWYFSLRIDRAENELKDLEDHTNTKTLMYNYLKCFIPDKLSKFWTLEELVQAIEEWPMKSKRFKKLSKEIGSLRFAQYLIDRALKMELIVSNEIMEDGELVEQYSIKLPDNA